MTWNGSMSLRGDAASCGGAISFAWWYRRRHVERGDRAFDPRGPSRRDPGRSQAAAARSGGTCGGRSGPAALVEWAAAATDATVLLQGETGTGKEGAAEALHLGSARRDKPLVVVDCAAIPANLLESELFGHDKGSFTGATVRRIGAFEEADGGTILLDEIGELPLELQPKLLRVLERKEIRRVGTNQMARVDVRVIAATHRDLRSAVNRHTYREDLYFRLAVVRITLPPLRDRPEDIPLLVQRFLEQLGAQPEVADELRRPEFVAALQRHSWPGNVRQ